MANYVIGGWSQSVRDLPPSKFSYTMYGMITNLRGLTSGTPDNPGWSPVNTNAPSARGKVLWTYGGGGCTPTSMPSDENEIDAIINAAKTNGWDGVDFDDECNMNIDNLVLTINELKALTKQTSYTFIGGWAYNNPNASSSGQAINEAVKQIAESNSCDRFVLMCYATAMWSMADIEANVGPAILRTIDYVNDPKKVVLALTPAGLTQTNLDYFLNEVVTKDIGGLFIWNFPILQSNELNTIIKRLGI